jgi:ABC-type phosphate transport system substrate-binding protein
MRAALAIALVLVAVGLGAAGAARADDAAFLVIVHPDNPVAAVDRGFLRDVFLKKATSWRHGPGARPVDLPPGRPREQFTKSVLKKSRSQLRSYWNQQIFSGKGVPPPEAESVAAAIAFVRTHPGAIGYVPAGTDTGGARVVRIAD